MTLYDIIPMPTSIMSYKVPSNTPMYHPKRVSFLQHTGATSSICILLHLNLESHIKLQYNNIV